MTTRRHFLITGVLAGAALAADRALVRAADATRWPASLAEKLAEIEKDSRGRLGVAVLDSGSSATAGLHADDRFPMCSTFKLLATAAVLQRAEDGKDKLDRRIKIEAGDVVPGSSFIKAPIAEGMTLVELCETAITYSDNTAGNLILASIGGPEGLTAYARTLGDTITRLDRNEPTLNEAIPGDLRDTTTPSAMLENMQKLLLGDALKADSKKLLVRMLVDNKTGGTRLRAGLPTGWRCGDKTGTGERGSTNDVGILWPPQGAPILVTCYLTETDAPADKRNAALAAVARAVTAG